jgi:peptidoglycan hydrolase-like protein with peptidoglycan-binding domain
MSGGIGRVNTGSVAADLHVDAAATPATPAADARIMGLASGAFKNDATLNAVLRGERTLEKGARGDAVKLVQQGLQRCGIAVSGGADGIFGNGTANALSAYQRQKGLPATGKLDQTTLLALDRDVAAKEAGATTGTGGTGGAGTSPKPLNARFASDPTLQAIAAGRGELKSGSRGAGVQAVQQALLECGYNMPVYGADGGYGGEASAAVKRFQRDMGLPQTGKVDRKTLEKLSEIAPPPGKTLERNPEYDKLFEDGRVDMTIAQGYDEHGTTEGSIYNIQRGLQSQGFRRIDPERMSAADRQKLGVGADRFEKGATYYTKKITDPASQKPVDVVVKLITPSSASSPEEVRDMFKRALEKDEVVTYNGHARYGTGPDFDVIDSGRGNFVMDRDGGPTGHPHEPLTGALRDKPESMLKDLKPFPGKYQLLYFNACTTENYMDNLRDPAKFLGRNPANTDILGTTIPTRLATGADHVLSFVNMVQTRGTVNSMVAANNKREQDMIQSFIDQGYTDSDLNERTKKLAGGTLFESGFADNAANRVR